MIALPSDFINQLYNEAITKELNKFQSSKLAFNANSTTLEVLLALEQYDEIIQNVFLQQLDNESLLNIDLLTGWINNLALSIITKQCTNKEDASADYNYDKDNFQQQLHYFHRYYQLHNGLTSIMRTLFVSILKICLYPYKESHASKKSIVLTPSALILKSLLTSWTELNNAFQNTSNHFYLILEQQFRDVNEINKKKYYQRTNIKDFSSVTETIIGFLGNKDETISIICKILQCALTEFAKAANIMEFFQSNSIEYIFSLNKCSQNENMVYILKQIKNILIQAHSSVNKLSQNICNSYLSSDNNYIVVNEFMKDCVGMQYFWMEYKTQLTSAMMLCFRGLKKCVQQISQLQKDNNGFIFLSKYVQCFLECNVNLTSQFPYSNASLFPYSCHRGDDKKLCFHNELYQLICILMETISEDSKNGRKPCELTHNLYKELLHIFAKHPLIFAYLIDANIDRLTSRCKSFSKNTVTPFRTEKDCVKQLLVFYLDIIVNFFSIYNEKQEDENSCGDCKDQDTAFRNVVNEHAITQLWNLIVDFLHDDYTPKTFQLEFIDEDILDALAALIAVTTAHSLLNVNTFEEERVENIFLKWYLGLSSKSLLSVSKKEYVCIALDEETNIISQLSQRISGFLSTIDYHNPHVCLQKKFIKVLIEYSTNIQRYQQKDYEDNLLLLWPSWKQQLLMYILIPAHLSKNTTPSLIENLEEWLNACLLRSFQNQINEEKQAKSDGHHNDDDCHSSSDKKTLPLDSILPCLECYLNKKVAYNEECQKEIHPPYIYKKQNCSVPLEKQQEGHCVIHKNSITFIVSRHVIYFNLLHLYRALSMFFKKKKKNIMNKLFMDQFYLLNQQHIHNKTNSLSDPVFRPIFYLKHSFSLATFHTVVSLVELLLNHPLSATSQLSTSTLTALLDLYDKYFGLQSETELHNAVGTIFPRFLLSAWMLHLHLLIVPPTSYDPMEIWCVVWRNLFTQTLKYTNNLMKSSNQCLCCRSMIQSIICLAAWVLSIYKHHCENERQLLKTGFISISDVENFFVYFGEPNEYIKFNINIFQVDLTSLNDFLKLCFDMETLMRTTYSNCNNIKKTIMTRNRSPQKKKRRIGAS